MDVRVNPVAVKWTGSPVGLSCYRCGQQGHISKSAGDLRKRKGISITGVRRETGGG
jgi:hypothetical protein